MFAFLLFAAELLGPVIFDVEIFSSSSAYQFSPSPSKARSVDESSSPAKKLEFSPEEKGEPTPAPHSSESKSAQYHAYLKKQPEILSLVPAVQGTDTRTKAQELTTALEQSRKQIFSDYQQTRGNDAKIDDEFSIVSSYNVTGKWNGIFHVSNRDVSKVYTVIIQNAISARIRNSFIKTLLDDYEVRKVYFPDAYRVETSVEKKDKGGEEGHGTGGNDDPSKKNSDNNGKSDPLTDEKRTLLTKLLTWTGAPENRFKVIGAVVVTSAAILLVIKYGLPVFGTFNKANIPALAAGSSPSSMQSSTVSLSHDGVGKTVPPGAANLVASSASGAPAAKASSGSSQLPQPPKPVQQFSAGDVRPKNVT